MRGPDAVTSLPLHALDVLVGALTRRGYRVIGPTIADGAIVYREIDRADVLPVGWRDEQAPGRYRLVRRDDAARFGYAVGPQSWKRQLVPPERVLWRARQADDGAMHFETPVDDPGPQAFIGVRGCELGAIRIQDRVYRGGTFEDPAYAARRDAAFVVAVECGTPADTCFCTSTGDGPGVPDATGVDLVLTELVDGDRHVFLARAGTPAGAEVLEEMPTLGPASADDAAARAKLLDDAAAAMHRALPANVREALADQPEHPQWNDVASRCLACGNCTLVCPTCFCATVEDVSLLSDDGPEHDGAARVRRWDSCFSSDHSYIHGGPVRRSTRARYRQWATHKLSTWYDQFGSSGCTGCGRCITWCPVGIDLVAEVTAVAATASAGEEA